MSNKHIVIGAGALGSLLTHSLSRSSKVRLHPLRARECSWPPNFAPPVQGIPQNVSFGALPESLDELYVWVCVKAFDLDQVIAELKPKLSPTSTVILLQNGLGIYLQVAFELGQRTPLLRVLPQVGLQRSPSNEVVISGAFRAMTAASSTHDASLDAVEAELNELGWNLTREKSVAIAEWKKLFVNLVVNTLATLAGDKNAIVVSDQDLKQRASLVLKEARAVAVAEGFIFEELTDQKIFDGISAHAENRNSTLQDFEQGRPTEIPYILGRFLRLAERYGVDTPECRMLASELEAVGIAVFNVK